MYNTPEQTRINAKNVPTLVRSTKKSILKNNAGMATIKTVTTVANDGVLYLGWTVANRFRSNPSRLLVIHIRGCAGWKTSKAAVIATTDVTDTMPAKLYTPTNSKINDKGSFK